ncbi:MAG: ABC transporter permease subunit [Sulfurovum sp.]|nr:ABC transporter permease subunit [Sulfurovum sp.]
MNRQQVLTAIGFMLLLSGWQILAMNMHQILLASPIQAITSLWEMLHTPYFYDNFLISIKRISLGIIFGGFSGFVFGTIAGINQNIKYLLDPLRWLIMSMPSVIIVVLAMLWFGMGSTMAVFMIAVITAPVVYVNTVKGIEAVDKELIEVAKIYKFPFFTRIKNLYTPAIAGPLSAAIVMITCQGARIAVMAELLGANEGIGYAVGITRSNLEIPQLFAWILTTLFIVAIFEFVLFRPIQNYFMRWQR